MKAHLRAPFGTVAIFRDPNPTGDSPAMGELGLVLYRDSGSKGSVVAYLLDRGITVSRVSFKTVPISASVLAHLFGVGEGLFGSTLHTDVSDGERDYDRRCSCYSSDLFINCG
jgi:hypothetical protein